MHAFEATSGSGPRAGAASCRHSQAVSQAEDLLLDICPAAGPDHAADWVNFGVRVGFEAWGSLGGAQRDGAARVLPAVTGRAEGLGYRV